MAITAKQLSKSGARGKDIDSLIREQLSIIDDKLLRSDRVWGRNVVIHDLPTAIALPGLKKVDAQRIIYNAVIRSLDKRGFETAICITDEYSRLYIAWMTDLDTNEVVAMNALLKSKRVYGAGVDNFIQNGLVDAPHVASSSRAEPTQKLHFANKGIMHPRGGVEITRPTPKPGVVSNPEAEILGLTF